MRSLFSAKHFLLLFLLCSTAIFSEETPSYEEIEKGFPEDSPSGNGSPKPDQMASILANLDGEPSSVVGCGINLISGSYNEGAVDITTAGANPISLARTYSSSQREEGSFHDAWNLTHCDMVRDPYNGGDKHDPTTYLKEGTGAAFLFNYKKHDDLVLHKSSLENGLTNTGSGKISAHTNQKNLKLIQQDKKYREIVDGAGMRRFFRRTDDDSREYFRLELRENPSGTFLEYVYHDYAHDFMKYIKALDSKGKEVGWVRMDHPRRHIFKDEPKAVAHTSDGTFVEYFFERDGKHFLLQDVKPSNGIPTHYSYGKNRRLKRKSAPDGRYVETNYYEEGHNYVGGRDVKLEEFHKDIGRVCSQKAPVGTTPEAITTHSIFYCTNAKKEKKQSGGLYAGHATVHDALNYPTNYFWNKDQRLSRIERCDHLKNPYLIENIFWGEEEDAGNMVSRMFTNAAGQILMARSLKYDPKGNVTCERLFGDLTGETAAPIVINKEGIPQKNGGDCCSTQFRYDGSEYNLLVEQIDCNSITSYEYYPTYDLVLAKFIKDRAGNIKQRFFYEYDDNSLVTFEMVDDGITTNHEDLTGVTKRLSRITERTTKHPIGLPVLIQDAYLNMATGEYDVIKTVVNHYNSQGRLLWQKHDGSDLEFAYMLSWEYDERGNVISAKDALGQETRYQYDTNNNLIWEQGPRLDYHNEFTYDFSNRPISVAQVHASGARLVNSYSYDYLSRCTASVDVYGNTTRYEYDLLGRKTRVEPPLLLDWQGRPVEIALQTVYDELGNAVVKNDARTFQTRAKYNIRGAPIYVAHPDGSEEFFRYYLDGSLKWHRKADGTSLHFKYDYQARPVVTEQRDAFNNLILRSEFTYDAFHLLRESHSNGHNTTYKYDGAGRLIEKVADGQKTLFGYDTLGRVNRTVTYFGEAYEQFIEKIEEHDAAGRVIEERVTSGHGILQSRILYGYDEAGNKTTITTFNSSGMSVQKTSYTQSGEPFYWVDALGTASWKNIEYSHCNSLGQRVRYEEVTDGAGLTTCYEYDAIGRLSITTSKALWGGIVGKSEIFYDSDGNPCRNVDSAYNPADGSLISIHTTMRQFDGCNRLIELREGAYSSDERVSKIIYNNSGQKQAILYPDGIALHFQYDGAGRLYHRFSSDGTIDDVFGYDSFGNIIEAVDQTRRWVTRRIYDEKGRLREDQLSHGLSVKYAYDAAGRPISITLPDSSLSTYEYNGINLSKVRRFTSVGGQLRYIHQYGEYDLSGKLLNAQLLGNAGSVSWEYDLLGRMTRIASAGWQEAAAHFDGVGNLAAKYTKDPLYGSYGTVYGYDSLHQLVSEEKNGVRESCQFDSLHNRRSRNGAGAFFNANHQLVQDEKGAYRYDERGNLIEENKAGVVTTYTYDALNRMVCAVKGSTKTEYIYDPFHRRIVKSFWEEAGGGWQEVRCERAVFQGENEIGVYDTLGQAQSVRILGLSLRGGAEIAAAVAIELEGKVFVPIHDLQGSVTCLIDSDTGAIAATYRYSSFGEKEQTIIDPLAAKNPWQWMSKAYDSETELVFFGRRYYAPSTARWTTKDPLGHTAGPNLYGFVSNRPLHLLDLYGLVSYSQSLGGYQGGCQSGNSYGTSQVVSSINTLVSESRTMLADCLDFIGRHIVGIPYLRDIFCLPAHVIKGNGVEDYVSSYREEHSQNFEVGDFTVPGRRLIIVNGMLCSLEETRARAKAISDSLGGEKVFVCYNATHGWSMDLAEVFLEKIGFKTSPGEKLAKLARQCVKDVGPEGDVWIMGHSQATEITWGLTNKLRQDELKTITTFGFGGARIIPRGYFKKSYNYVSEADLIPRIADPQGYFKGLQGIRHLEVLPSELFLGMDHAMGNSAYSGMMDSVLNKYIKL